MPLKRLSILGVGLLGGSIGLAARSKISGCEVVGYGHRAQTLQAATEMGAIDLAATDAAAAVQDADITILCTPVGLFDQMLRAIAPALKRGAIVTDVGSTKRSVVEAAERLLPAGVHFVGSHPMAGSEKRGIEFARTDLFHNALCILTPAARTDPTALATVESFWRSLGMNCTRLAPEAHDRYLADVSHLPHAVAAAVVAMQIDEAMALAGKGFLDATRIASGDGGLWRDILLDNRDNLRAALRRLQAELTNLDRLLTPEHGDALRQWLDASAARRDALLLQKLREVTPD